MIGDWLDIGWLSEIPLRGSRTVTVEGGEDVAIFRTGDNDLFALLDRCPHKGGRLSQGIVHGGTVTCPLHSWKIQLRDGQVVPPDVGCVKHFATKVDKGEVFLAL